MLRSSSMYYAIIICVVVGICCSMLLLISHYSNLFALHMETRTELLENNRSAINYYLAKVSTIRETPEYMDLFDNGITSEAKVEPWGLYQVLHVRTLLKKDTVERSMLIGQKRGHGPALYLMDNDKPLQMVGKAKIIGDAFVPKKGIKRGYLSSQSYSSRSFLEGKQHQSGNTLPEIKTNFYMPQKENDSIVFLEGTGKGETFFNPFWKAPIHIEMGGNSIDRAKFSGKVMLHAKDSLFIAKDNEFEDILIKAPIVVFEKGFEGTVQVAASQKVILEEAVVLKYPSSIYVKAEGLDQATIGLAANSKVLGKMILIGTQEKKTGVDIIQIDQNAEIIGEVYCKASTQLKGKIIGTLYTDNFYLKTEATAHENYVEDGVIDLKSLSDKFLGTIANDGKRGYGIIKQL